MTHTALASGEPSEPWRPDEQLVPAILANSPLRMRDLTPPDRAWVVEALRLKGLTAEQIGDRLDCSLRQVRAIRAEPMAKVCMLYLVERESFANTHRMSETELRRLRAELADAEAARDRYKHQLDIMLDLHIVGEAGATFSCGCPKNRYNTYVHPAPPGKTAKTSCRYHRTLAVAAHRERARQIGEGIIDTASG